LVTQTAYTDTTVQAGQTYYYVTTAVDSSGNESTYSNEVQAVVP
jgi:fibronectin type 3 domain-containing protein